MDSVTPEDAIKIAAIRRKTDVCVLEAREEMRTFLADTLEELGFVTCGCAHFAELPQVLASQLPDIVVIGSSAGGIEACEIVELLAADDFDGQVLVLGSRVSPMVHKVSAKYTPLYVAEFQFRYNNPQNPDIFGAAIAGR